MDILIITGPPYSGKGTQCGELVKALGYKHVSTGDRCREEKKAETQFGKMMAEYEEKGDYVPDQMMKNLLSQILDENRDEKGIILDGYPRTIPQMDDLLSLTEEKGMKISKVLNIEVPEDILLQRALKRAAISTREDDKDPQVHIKRIRIFQELTVPAIAYMKTRLNVDDFSGTGEIENISKALLASIADL